MMQVAVGLFFLGFSASFGPCIAHCSLLILPHIAGTTTGWREGLRAILAFSFVRMGIYGVMGLLAGLLGRIFIAHLLRFERLIMVFGGLAIACVGMYIICGRRRAHSCRSASHKGVLNAGVKGAALLGLSAGVLPCLPLLGALTYIALHAQDPWQGALYGLSFGMGKLISPLIPLGMLAAGAPALLSRYNRALHYFTKLCGLILLAIGGRLVLIALAQT